ncbi:MAG: SCP2 sterol-binding domain-containing protein [Gammaproteobacteria bacterium]|nr:SCP2 sterol-binding domain-containing protein [Gammaproteobacteria bacterium]MBU1655685.1 SCP2 sterol-binding domain-containing protein [Gammaproteobacteria bacterium]MBU1961173.1 SCP2 sterol-binding domain-containing protein [Gammaproteobacteria bacterium]
MNPTASPPSFGPAIKLPSPLALPFRVVPDSVHSRVMAGLLNRVLAQYLREGELEMLVGRTLRVEIKDAHLGYNLTCDGKQLKYSGQPPDVTMSGDMHAFLLMLTRREDPDTLFFQRRLSIQGDTGLGLSVKNFLDSLDWDNLPLPQAAQKGLERALNLYQKLFG